VLLHGRGSDAREIIALADELPTGPTCSAVRAPIDEGGGYAWFANRGIGRPVPESLRTTMDWFRGWLDSAAPEGRPVVLIGFSGDAAFAGDLILDDPARYTGAAILCGTLPFDAGLPVEPTRLAGLPVLLARGEQDTVIPRELLDRTWSYLLGESGAPTVTRNDPVAHTVAPEARRALAGWLQERLALRNHRGAPAPGPTRWAMLPDGWLPTRLGRRPEVSVGIPPGAAHRHRTRGAAGAAVRPARRAARGHGQTVGHLGSRRSRAHPATAQARPDRRLPRPRHGGVRPPPSRIRRLAAPRAAAGTGHRRHPAIAPRQASP
jgi:phospholipase/carboxylesterase